MIVPLLTVVDLLQCVDMISVIVVIVGSGRSDL